MALWSQTRKQRCTSGSLAFIHGYIRWKIRHQCYHWEDYAMNWVILVRGRQEKLLYYQKKKKKNRKKSNAASKTSSPWLQLPNRKLYHPLKLWARQRSERHHVGSVQTDHRRIRKNYDVLSSTPKAGGDPKHVDEEKPLDDKLPSVVIDAEGDTPAKDTKSKKNHRFPTKSKS